MSSLERMTVLQLVPPLFLVVLLLCCSSSVPLHEASPLSTDTSEPPSMIDRIKIIYVICSDLPGCFCFR